MLKNLNWIKINHYTKFKVFKIPIYFLSVQEAFLSTIGERDTACCWILNEFFKESTHQNRCLDHKENLLAMGGDPFRCYYGQFILRDFRQGSWIAWIPIFPFYYNHLQTPSK